MAISMIGLINAITLAVLERTREIGMLRCIGARARDVRRIVATEGLAVALAGWLIGVPLGFGFAHGIVMLSGDAVNQTVLVTFPLEDIPIASAGTLVLAILVMLTPLHRAVALSPGDALRYG